MAVVLAGLPMICLASDGFASNARPGGGTPLGIDSLPNAHRLHANVIAGGQPDGEAGFQSLSSLGVRTIISVDGAKPNVGLAKKHGMRYVHLPHGYDRISGERAMQLAKAVSDLPGPVYVHCHHGKHRSPAAAAVACVGAGYLNRTEGAELLARMGTSLDYRGLHEAVASARRIEDLKDQPVEFREVVEVPPIQAAMVGLEHRYEQLAEIQRAGWRTPSGHPDLSPVHEALLLREQLTELLRAERTAGRTPDFLAILEHSVAATISLQSQLRHSLESRSVDQKSQLTDTLASIQQDCRQCHQRHRDQPPLPSSEAGKAFLQSSPQGN